MPLVSVLLATHNDAGFLRDAVRSTFAQTFQDVEIVVVDDASTDETPELLSGLSDERLVVSTNAEQAGLAASLNQGLEQARGRYVARLDADDIALPERLERQLACIRSNPHVAVVGSAVADLDADGRVGRTHHLPLNAPALRWHALFSSPFFHPTVLVDREVLDAHDLRYDTSFLESEDYDLWTRLFRVADGANVRDALVLKRVHPKQASLRRGDVQRTFQRQVALREIAHLAPALSADDAELAWSFGTRARADAAAADAFLAVLAAFERVHGVERAVRKAATRALLRARLVRHAARVWSGRR